MVERVDGLHAELSDASSSPLPPSVRRRQREAARPHQPMRGRCDVTSVGLRAALLALSLAALTVSVLGCRRREAPERRTTVSGAVEAPDGNQPSARSAGYVVDSVLPVEEALRRFRVGLSPTTSLSGGSTSRDALVARFVAALERGDTTALREMEVTKGEFAWLIYPSSASTRPPYRQQPEVAWLLERVNGDKGYRRLVDRLSGKHLAYRGYDCPHAPQAEGENRLWRNCSIRYANERGEPVSARLFGAIVERHHDIKFVSYANDF